MALPIIGAIVSYAASAYRAIQITRAAATGGAALKAAQINLANANIRANPTQLPSIRASNGNAFSGTFATNIGRASQNHTGASFATSLNQKEVSGATWRMQNTIYKEQLGAKLFKEAEKNARNQLKNAGKNAAATALGLSLIGGTAYIVGKNNDGPDGPYKPRPRPGPRHKDPYKPDPSEPGEEENNDDSSNSSSCVDVSGENLVAKTEEKTEITMFTPYGTLSTVR
jgi:hypothetical protein